MADVVMPQLGETVADGTVTKWFKQVGDVVVRGEPLFEVATDKVDTEIPSPHDGTLTAILVSEGTTVDVGTVLASIGASGEATPALADSPASSASSVKASGAPSAPTARAVAVDAERRLSPLVRRLLAENGLDAPDVVGTGPQGRITKEDVLAAASQRLASATDVEVDNTPSPSSAQLSPVVRRLLLEKGLDSSQIVGTGPNGRITRRDVELAKPSVTAGGASSGVRRGDEVIPFSRLRKLTAEHMVRSKATSAHTLMVREIDFESVERARRRHGDAFKAAEGFSLTYLPFIAVATLAALREFPHLNASVGEDELIVHHDLNLGVAVDLDSDGLVVPVIRDADRLDVTGVARRVRDLATRARAKSLGVDEMGGGTFTITNPGPYGTLMTGAVINQPQVAILATDGITRKPVVVTSEGAEAIAIHSVGLVALTFDHRAVDGAYAARFLRRLAELLEGTDWAATL